LAIVQSLGLATLILTLTTSLVMPRTAFANGFGLYGAGARGAAMGGALSATADDFTAVYYNLAAMVLQESNVGIGFVFGFDDVAIRLKQRPAGFDTPNQGPNSLRLPTDVLLRPRSDTTDIPTTYGLIIGALGSFGINNLRFGVIASIPLSAGVGSQRTFFPDEREQFFSNRLNFTLLGERTQTLVTQVGLAYQIADWVAIGAGLSFMPSNQTLAQVYVDNPTDQSDVDLVLNNDQSGLISPMVGLLLMPLPKWRISAVYRGEIFFDLSGTNEIQVRGFQEDDDFPTFQNYNTAVNYLPHEFVFGSAYVSETWVVGVDVQWQLWNQFRDQQANQDTGLRSTIGTRIGVEYNIPKGFRYRTGAGFELTPVPEQTGRTSYVDNDRLFFTVGMGHPFKAFGNVFEISWYLQYHYLIPRDTNKKVASSYPSCDSEQRDTICNELADDLTDPETGEQVPEYQGLQTNNPGFPGFQSFGQLIAFGLDLRWNF